MKKTILKTNKMNRARLAAFAAAAVVPAAFIPNMASGQVIYSDGFSTAGDSANYNIYQATAGTSDATFGYDYSALGIPVAPDTTDGSTLGLRLRVDNLGNSVSPASVGAISVVTSGLTLPSQYVITVDVWGNYIGGPSTPGTIATSGSNGTTAPGLGIGTSGAALQSPNGGSTGMFVDSFHDGGGGANLDYRAYVGSTREDPATTPYYAAGESSTAGGHANSYYSFLSSQSAPSYQQSNYASTQTGSTPTGIIAFQWTTWTITQDGANVTWAINGHTIATIPDSLITSGGSQVSLDSIDSGLSGQTAANNQLLNFDIFDNFTITSVPEPGALSLLALGAVGLFARRRTVFKK
jgi:PEP-CTERM motif